MNDAARIAADDRDLREMIRHPRGCRLSELPLTSGNLGRDDLDDDNQQPEEHHDP